jgi:hypothetical protein
MEPEIRVVERSSSPVTALIAFGVGAAMMYFFDPVSGRRRRALVRDQLVHARTQIADTAQAKAKHLRNVAQGAAAEARSAVERTRDKVEDQLQPASPQPRV